MTGLDPIVPGFNLAAINGLRKMTRFRNMVQQGPFSQREKDRICNRGKSPGSQQTTLVMARLDRAIQEQKTM
jgi:hypothetical protein